MRLIDADALWDELTEDLEDGDVLYRIPPSYIDDAPTIDAVPVVRCKGCGHAERYERTDGTAGYYCGHPQNTFVFGDRWDRVFKPVKKPDDFCSYGERKAKND
nr:MAG TPA: baseplate protein [Caudoviricetes sp.]